jgi:hypothetical protein
MDTKELVAHAQARFDHQAARRTLTEKYQAKLTFAHSGGMWSAGPELICVLTAVDTQDIVLLDLYNTPVRTDRSELLQLVSQRWQEQMTAWSLEYQEISNNR